ncbi:hypothetical protein FUAX_06090 [Fulvitalea axinellae]|uniref:Carboxypeptidase-like regulatory domain-containing protein n=1 Tax=Fulvitalea axinellae TaxID=1182444 RepID=A0AAU9CMU1_9BACT|nr:hypothetical protein FUAX_06090 [Fulvitalea axinellae]
MNRFFLTLSLILVTFAFASAQNTKEDGPKILQFSGQVVDGETMEPLSGVHIFVPKSGRGTTTNIYGYFTMPVAAGDSLVASTVGYIRKHYEIPENYDKNITFVMNMEYDTLYLPELEIKPYPTEEDFKQAVLTMEMPDPNRYNQNIMGNVDRKVIRQAAYALGNDGASGYSEYQNQYFQNLNRGSMAPSSNFLNPFAWSRFFRDMKKDKKKK